ncbi:hypothetical protein PHYPSEUDO_000582 [Phytophthora pseudosyringae]|uniref:Uncharacterized protein n=1 Tax=Phytophthora pseudosyringae TaxID=221518 RepID=A0A8T1W1S8_9STRA|nr:hypothetical protein PHYPSEUDO_000582 [Phytophthora pseudosyringae]
MDRSSSWTTAGRNADSIPPSRVAKMATSSPRPPPGSTAEAVATARRAEHGTGGSILPALPTASPNASKRSSWTTRRSSSPDALENDFHPSSHETFVPPPRRAEAASKVATTGARAESVRPSDGLFASETEQAQLAYMEQMYGTIHLLNAELERSRAALESATTTTTVRPASHSDRSSLQEDVPLPVGDFVVSQTPVTPSYSPRKLRATPSPPPQSQHRVARPPVSPRAVVVKDQELCATLGKNAELRIRSRDMERAVEKTELELELARKQIKTADRRAENREEKLRALLKEKLNWQKELKATRAQVVEEKMRQVDLFRDGEAAKHHFAAELEALEQEFRAAQDENAQLRTHASEMKAQMNFQARKIDDVARQAQEEKARFVAMIEDTRHRFREWKEGEADALAAAHDQAVRNLKTEHELRMERHQDEKQKLRDKVNDLEVSMRLLQRDRVLSPLELSLRKTAILGSKEHTGTMEAEQIESQSRILELENLLAHSHEYQARQESIIKLSEATISRLMQEREVTALENLSLHPFGVEPQRSEDLSYDTQLTGYMTAPSSPARRMPTPGIPPRSLQSSNESPIVRSPKSRSHTPRRADLEASIAQAAKADRATNQAVSTESAGPSSSEQSLMDELAQLRKELAEAQAKAAELAKMPEAQEAATPVEDVPPGTVKSQVVQDEVTEITEASVQSEATPELKTEHDVEETPEAAEVAHEKHSDEHPNDATTNDLADKVLCESPLSSEKTPSQNADEERHSDNVVPSDAMSADDIDAESSPDMSAKEPGKPIESIATATALDGIDTQPVEIPATASESVEDAPLVVEEPPCASQELPTEHVTSSEAVADLDQDVGVNLNHEETPALVDGAETCEEAVNDGSSIVKEEQEALESEATEVNDMNASTELQTNDVEIAKAKDPVTLLDTEEKKAEAHADKVGETPAAIDFADSEELSCQSELVIKPTALDHLEGGAISSSTTNDSVEISEVAGSDLPTEELIPRENVVDDAIVSAAFALEVVGPVAHEPNRLESSEQGACAGDVSAHSGVSLLHEVVDSPTVTPVELENLVSENEEVIPVSDSADMAEPCVAEALAEIAEYIALSSVNSLQENSEVVPKKIDEEPMPIAAIIDDVVDPTDALESATVLDPPILPSDVVDAATATAVADYDDSADNVEDQNTNLHAGLLPGGSDEPLILDNKPYSVHECHQEVGVPNNCTESSDFNASQAGIDCFEVVDTIANRTESVEHTDGGGNDTSVDVTQEVVAAEAELLSQVQGGSMFSAQNAFLSSEDEMAAPPAETPEAYAAKVFVALVECTALPLVASLQVTKDAMSTVAESAEESSPPVANAMEVDVIPATELVDTLAEPVEVVTQNMEKVSPPIVNVEGEDDSVPSRVTVDAAIEPDTALVDTRFGAEVAVTNGGDVAVGYEVEGDALVLTETSVETQENVVALVTKAFAENFVKELMEMVDSTPLSKDAVEAVNDERSNTDRAEGDSIDISIASPDGEVMAETDGSLFISDTSDSIPDEVDNYSVGVCTAGTPQVELVEPVKSVSTVIAAQVQPGEGNEELPSTELNGDVDALLLEVITPTDSALDAESYSVDALTIAKDFVDSIESDALSSVLLTLQNECCSGTTKADNEHENEEFDSDSTRSIVTSCNITSEKQNEPTAMNHKSEETLETSGDEQNSTIEEADTSIHEDAADESHFTDSEESTERRCTDGELENITEITQIARDCVESVERAALAAVAAIGTTSGQLDEVEGAEAHDNEEPIAPFCVEFRTQDIVSGVACLFASQAIAEVLGRLAQSCKPIDDAKFVRESETTSCNQTDEDAPASERHRLMHDIPPVEGGATIDVVPDTAEVEASEESDDTKGNNSPLMETTSDNAAVISVVEMLPETITTADLQNVVNCKPVELILGEMLDKIDANDVTLSVASEDNDNDHLAQPDVIAATTEDASGTEELLPTADNVEVDLGDNGRSDQDAALLYGTIVGTTGSARGGLVDSIEGCYQGETETPDTAGNQTSGVSVTMEKSIEPANAISWQEPGPTTGSRATVEVRDDAPKVAAIQATEVAIPEVQTSESLDTNTPKTEGTNKHGGIELYAVTSFGSSLEDVELVIRLTLGSLVEATVDTNEADPVVPQVNTAEKEAIEMLSNENICVGGFFGTSSTLACPNDSADVTEAAALESFDCTGSFLQREVKKVCSSVERKSTPKHGRARSIHFVGGTKGEQSGRLNVARRSVLLWQAPFDTACTKEAMENSAKRRASRRRTSRRIFADLLAFPTEMARFTSSDTTLLAYDAQHEQGHIFSLLDQSILTINPNGQHIHLDDSDDRVETKMIGKRKTLMQELHSKNLALRQIPRFNYMPMCIKFQWSDFVVASPVRPSNSNLGEGHLIQSPVEPMRLLQKKGAKLPCGTYVVISAFVRPLEDGNENLRVQIYDAERVEEFQFDFSEDIMKNYHLESTGMEAQSFEFLGHLEFRRDEDTLIIKLPEKKAGKGSKSEADRIQSERTMIGGGDPRKRDPPPKQSKTSFYSQKRPASSPAAVTSSQEDPESLSLSEPNSAEPQSDAGDEAPSDETSNAAVHETAEPDHT